MATPSRGHGTRPTGWLCTTNAEGARSGCHAHGLAWAWQRRLTTPAAPDVLTTGHAHARPGAWHPGAPKTDGLCKALPTAVLAPPGFTRFVECVALPKFDAR